MEMIRTPKHVVSVPHSSISLPVSKKACFAICSLINFITFGEIMLGLATSLNVRPYKLYSLLYGFSGNRVNYLIFVRRLYTKYYFNSYIR